MRRWMLSAIVAAGGVLAVCIAFDLYPGLRGGAGWQWSYVPAAELGGVLLLAVVLAVYVMGASLLDRRGGGWALAWWAVLGGAAVGFAVTATQGDVGFTLFSRTVSPVQTGASALATRIMTPQGTLETLQRWPAVMQEALDANLIHFTTSPPGQPLFHQFLAGVFDSPLLSGVTGPLSLPLRLYQCADVQVMNASAGEIVSAGVGIGFPLLAALLALAVYALAHDLTGDRRTAGRAAAWSALIPALGMFAPTWNTLYPVLCVLSFWLLGRGLMRQRLGWVLSAGVVLSLTTFLNFSVLPLLLLMGLYTLAYTLWVRPTAEGLRALVWPVTVGVVFGVGLLSVWVIFTLMTGVSPVDILRETFTTHKDLVVREYAPWLILHVWDVLLFTGLPAALLAIWGVVRALRRRQADALDALTLCMAATVMAVNLAGIVQGENARILLFYMPFLVLMGASVYREAGVRGHLALLSVQAVVLAAMASVLYVVPLDMNPPALVPRSDIGGLTDVPWNTMDVDYHSADYAGEVRLAAVRHVSDPAQQAITFEFLWQGGIPTERPYHFELVARAQDPEVGEVVAQLPAWTAQGGQYPPTCWRAGQTVNDVVVLNVPAVSAPVVWSVALRVVDERTGDVLRHAGGDTLILPPVQYP